MRLSRTFLALAATLAGPLSGANITVDADLTLATTGSLVDGGGRVNNYAVGNDAILTIDLRNALGAPVDATFNGRLLDGSFSAGALVPGLDRTGTILKTGGGTLQYNGFADMVYLRNASFDTALNNPLPSDLRPLLENPDANPLVNQINEGAGQAFSGILIVREGQLQVSGHINQWADYGAYNAALNAAAGGAATMHGARATVVENGAKISFRNTTRNLVGASVNVGSPDSTAKTPLIGRLNYLQNVLGTTASRVETGPDADYFLVIHSDIAGAGIDPDQVTETTLGILEGKGRVYKTGASDLRITNGSTFDGEFVGAGGRIILSAGSGDTLWSANSVNLASGGNGTNVGPAADIDWKPGYVPAASASTLVVQGAQRIRNFQSLYQDAGFTALVQPGTGAGNLVELVAANDILTVQQDAGLDGYFTGSFVGALDEDTGVRAQALGTLRKTGAGALALFSVGNNMSRLEILGGRVVSNVQSLGSGEVYIGDDGQLSIVQNDAGALRAVIRTETTDRNAELRFKPTDSIQYRGADGADLGNADAGVADIVVAQTFFYGRVIVEDGNAIVFSAGNNNAFANSSTVELLEGASGRETSIRFNDTNQVINNLQGAASTRIYLGRGDITLAASAAGSYAGIISGVGNFIKQGAATYALSGPNAHFGATVVREGVLSATAASAIGNTSGLVIAASGDPVRPNRLVATGDQSVGALFGEAGTVVTIGGALTVGVSDDLRSRLVTALASIPGQFSERSAYYFATDTTQVIDGFAFTPATSVIYLVRQYGLADADLDGATTDAEVRAYLGLAPAADLLALSAEDAQAVVAAHGDLLAFDGDLSLGGSLTKVGAERTTLRGSVTFTSADRRVIVQGGTLAAAHGTLAASEFSLAAAGTYEVDVQEAATLSIPVTGTGTLRKTGLGTLTVDIGSGRKSAFDGLHDVAEGELAVVFRASETAGLAREGSAAIAAGATFRAVVAGDLAWQGEVYGEGDFIKSGSGTLTLTEGLVFTEGLVRVESGTLVAGAAPAAGLEILAGATYVADTAVEDDFYDGVLSGAAGSTFAKDGAFDLRMEVAAPDFAGLVDVRAGSLSLWEDEVFASASSVKLAAGTRLLILDGTTQSLANVDADAAATVEVVDLGPGISTTLTLDVAAGTTSPFSSRILGFPDLVKTGAGKLAFIRPAASPNEIATIDIRAGELEASQAGLGGADITLGAAGTLRFFADTGEVADYAGLVLAGTGTVAKSGAGTVDLSAADLATVASSFDLTGGTLVLSRAALGARLPTATLAGGATLAFATDDDVILDATGISGAGNLELRGGFVVDLTLGADGSPGYTGATRLADGVTVRLDSPTAAAALGGLAAESGTTLDTALLASLRLELEGDTAFGGSLAGGADLVLAGDGTLDFSGGDTGGDLSGYAGAITVRSGIVLDMGNTKALSLDGGRLILVGGGLGANYTGALTGTGDAVLRASLDLSGPNLAGTSFDDGALRSITVETGGALGLALVDGGFHQSLDLVIAGGNLTGFVGAADTTLTLGDAPAGTTDAGELILLSTGPGGGEVTVNGDINGRLEVDAGISAVIHGDVARGVGILGAATLGVSGQPAITVGGEINVIAGGVLRGSAVAAGDLNVDALSRVEPGFSPGTVTVANLVNAGTLSMELGTAANDTILFSGTATPNAGGTGVLELRRHLEAGESAASTAFFGRRAAILRDTAAPGAGSFVGSGFSDIVSPTADNLRALVFYPAALALDPRLAIPGLAVDGELAVHAARADADYAALLGPDAYLARIQAATRVNLVADLLDPTLSRSQLSATFTPFGARLATLADAALLRAVGNLSPRGHAALLSGATAGFRAHADALQRRLEQRRFDGADMSVRTDDWFADATHGQLDLDNGHEARSTGATAGTLRPLGVDGYWAVTLGVDNLKADGGSGSYKGNGFRVGAALGVMNVARTVSLDAGVSYGRLSGDLTRASLLGSGNVTDPRAATLGAWVRLSGAGALGGVAITPFVSIEHSRTSLDATAEDGFADPLGDSLAVDQVDHTQTAARAGLGLHRSWVSEGGDWRYRLGLEVAYAMQLDGDEADLIAEHAQLGGAPVTSTFGVLPGDGFSVAPTLTFGSSPDSTFTLGLRLEQGSEGEATSLQFGYRRKF